MNKPIITVRDMNLWYGQTQALKNINIDIPEKSITALIGPSGCGSGTSGRWTCRSRRGRSER